jgi:hypothetical protein
MHSVTQVVRSNSRINAPPGDLSRALVLAFGARENGGDVFSRPAMRALVIMSPQDAFRECGILAVDDGVVNLLILASPAGGSG